VTIVSYKRRAYDDTLSKTITAEAEPEWAKSKSRDESFQGRARAQRFQSSIIAALSAKVASRAFIGPSRKKQLSAILPMSAKTHSRRCRSLRMAGQHLEAEREVIASWSEV
jgi:hypothetical protein